MSKPLIGITAGEIVNRDFPWLPITYGQRHPFIDAVIAGGGAPVILPITKNNEVLDDLSARLDGILFSGGNDIDPSMYGEKPGKRVLDPSKIRDQVEKRLLKNALDKGIPILGLCRGMQMINIYQGGTLYQDIPTDLPGKLNHESSNIAQDLEDKAHTIEIDKNSKLYKLVKKDLIHVNTHHHQSVKKLGKGLRITARSEDGIVEALETDDDRFIIGIQAHPESLIRAIPEWVNVFKEFVRISSNLK